MSIRSEVPATFRAAAHVKRQAPQRALDLASSAWSTLQDAYGLHARFLASSLTRLRMLGLEP